ncbi:MAG: hypothetical protein RL662_631 [Bacteroidota bacterium]|jgi:hypothetical protein
MKNISIKIASYALALLSITSCDIDDKFVSPDKVDKGTVSAFYTSMLNNLRMRTEYFDVRSMRSDHVGIYAQTMVINNGSSIYKERDGYIADFWKDYYVSREGDEYGGKGGTLAMYAFMNTTNETDLPEIQLTNMPFMNAAKVVVADRTAQMVDLFGDIPFSEASSLLATGQNIPAKFDDQQVLYKNMIVALKEAGDYFKTAKETSFFTGRDMLLKGNTTLWCKYANSVRLRLLMRIVEIDPTYAQPQIMEILDNPAAYPLIDGDNNPNYDPKASDVLLHPRSDYNKSLNEALNEGNAKVPGDFMLNKLMLPTKDPRLDVMFDKNGQTEYRTVAIGTSADQITGLAKTLSCWDSTTFWQNTKIPGVRMTASEVNFLKAEAFERWGSTADAKLAYETAIRQSISFYYYLNKESSNAKKAPVVTEFQIADFLANGVPYTGTQVQKLELIGTQKWLHFGWLQGYEAWAEYRRTKYPVLLPFPADAKDAGYETPPTRLLYPTAETSINPHYEDVRSKNTRVTRIFWDVK